MKCERCKKSFEDDDFTFCPYCGESLKKDEKYYRRVLDKIAKMPVANSTFAANMRKVARQALK
jgi:uncharacterized membrane protein YvbJ